METSHSRRRSWPDLVGIVLAAALSVAACGSSGATFRASGATSTPTSTARTPSAPTSAPTSIPSPTAEPVCPTVTTQTVTSSASDSSWTVSFKEPVASGVPAAVAAAMNGAINNKVSGFVSDFTGQSLTPVIDSQPSTLNGEFTIGLCSPTLLSLRFEVTEYVTGAASTFELVSSLNFAVSTGTIIQLTDLFTSSAAALPVLSSQAQTLLLADPDLGGVLSWPSSPPMSFFETCWVFTTAGLEFTWNQGEIAASAAGAPSATILWTDPSLRGVISTSGPAAEFL
jgi:hypothetical protein